MVEKPNSTPEDKAVVIKQEKIKKLTPMQQLFVEEYLVDFNAAGSAARAGYAPKNSRKAGYELLTLHKYRHVQAMVKARLEERKKLIGYDQQFVIESLQSVQSRCMQSAPVMKYNPKRKEFEPLTDNDGKNIYQFDSVGANRATELLGRHLGMFNEKMQTPEENNVTAQAINITIIQEPSKNDAHKVQAHTEPDTKRSVESTRKASDSVQSIVSK